MYVLYPRKLSIYERMGTMYRVKYSSAYAQWFIQADEGTDDFGTGMYDSEQEAYDDLAQMVKEGLIKQEEISRSEIGR